MIEVKQFEQKGRGIVATEPISKGMLIESAPVAIFPPEEWEVMEPTAIFKYCFVRPSEYDGQRTENGYIVFGLSSLCNHSQEPNAHIQWIENENGLWANLTAVSDIPIGEEVVIFYTNIDKYSSASKFVS